MLVRTWQFPSFRRAIEFVNQVAALIEKTDHYPDILVSFRNVRLEMSTHAVGGLTDRDFALISRSQHPAHRSLARRPSGRSGKKKPRPAGRGSLRDGRGDARIPDREQPVAGRLASRLVACHFESSGRFGPDCPGARRRYLVLGRLKTPAVGTQRSSSWSTASRSARVSTLRARQPAPLLQALVQRHQKNSNHACHSRRQDVDRSMPKTTGVTW